MLDIQQELEKYKILNSKEEPISDYNQIHTIRDLKLEPVSPEEAEKIKNMLGDQKCEYKNAWKIISETTSEAFDKYCEKETNLSNNKQKDDLEIQKYSTIKETKIPDRKYLELVIKDTAESHMRTQLRRNYPRKYLIMEASKVNPGKFDVTEGHIGIRIGRNRPRKYSLSMNEWDSFYLSKISKGWDAKLEYNSLQIKEILLGLEAGLDVSVYTILDSEGKPVFDAGQMSVIRKGLEKGLDVNVYAKLEYDDDKMYEILHSLIIGLPKEIVKQEIANPEFSYKEMAERREELDKEFYELGEIGLLEKYGITPEKENSIEENKTEKDEYTLDTSEEMSL